MRSRRKFSSSGAKEANTGISEESSPKNKKRKKIDLAYLSSLKATGQVPVIRFTVTVEIPNRDSRRKIGSIFVYSTHPKSESLSFIRSMMYLYVSYYHRATEGASLPSFYIKRQLENSRQLLNGE